MSTLSQPPAMVRMSDGRYVPASRPFDARKVTQTKLLLILQYYEGDKQAAEELGSLIADLERVRNRNTDVMIFARHDATEYDRTIRTKLEAKFDKVVFQRCRRKDAKTYPFASNEMFYDLVTLVGQFAPWKDDYFAFLNLESDCTPLHPGWIAELVDQFQIAKARGYSAIGHLCINTVGPAKGPPDHMNGVAVYSTDFWKTVGAGKLNGGNPQVAYDVFHAKDILPHAQDTPYITLSFNRPTISPADLFKRHKGNVESAIYHGVKDDSARAAVRARHIEFSEVQEKTVFTYFHAPGHIGADEQKAILSAWKEAWLSRGWNPVVLTFREASQNGKLAAFSEAVKKFPDVTTLNPWLRWLALETIGGGFLVDYDVVPARFTPAQLRKYNELAPFSTFSAIGDETLSAAQFSREKIAEWVSVLTRYEVQPGDTIVTDRTIFERAFADPVNRDQHAITLAYGKPGWKEAAMIHFSDESMLKHGVKGERKSSAMERYLRGE